MSALAGAAALTCPPAHAGDAPALHIGPLKIGGALRYNYIYEDWNPEYRGKGRFDFDTARLNLDLVNAGPIIGSAEYRYYRFRGGHQTNFVHHAWLGYRFRDGSELQAGIQKVPFGILPYASHNWFFQIAYYVGLEDDYDLGFKYVRDMQPWNVQLAWYAASEPHGAGRSNDSARYSYDLVKDLGAANKERNQFNARVTYTFTRGAHSSTELGLSTLWGQVPNDASGRTGSHYAVGAHLNGNYGRWNLMLEFIRYAWNVEDPPGRDPRLVVMGAYDFPYRVAAAGNIYAAGLAYHVPLGWGPIKGITFYDDFSVLDKDVAAFANTYHNVLGASVAAGGFFIYFDIGSGRNSPFLGPDFTNGLGTGGPVNQWSTRFNVNIGYYF